MNKFEPLKPCPFCGSTFTMVTEPTDGFPDRVRAIHDDTSHPLCVLIEYEQEYSMFFKNVKHASMVLNLRPEDGEGIA